MKKTLVFLILLGLLTSGCAAIRQASSGSAASGNLQTEPARRGDLTASVTATGVVRANQTALLTWHTSGTVASVESGIGDQVTTGQELATLEQTSLPKNVILAQADLITAQRDLENLKQSQLQRAQAMKAVKDAQQALDDARNPEAAQAKAAENLANAQKAVDEAQRQYDILTSPISQAAIDQAHANLLLAESALQQIQDQIDRIEKKLNKSVKDYWFWESRALYRKILDNLKMVRTQRQIAYDDAVSKYNRLQEPVDATDLAVAQGNLDSAKAQLSQAQRDWERSKDGTSPAEIAVLEAKLADAQREWERVKDGPDENDLLAAEARITAAEAAISQIRITPPFDGVITEVTSQPGDQVSPGSLAFRLDDLSRLMVDVPVSEIDINNIKVGESATLSFDSIPAKEYHGKIVEVPLFGNVQQDVATFNVVVELTDADTLVRAGMTAGVTIVVEQVKDVLLVPNQAIRILQDQRVVYVLQNGKPAPLEVTLGISSGAYTQVLKSDLKVGDQIVLNPPSSLSNGG